MGKSLDAYVGYGFVIDKYFEEENDVPDIFRTLLSKKEVAEFHYYSDVSDVEPSDYLQAVLESKFPQVALEYPGTEHGDEAAIYLKSTETNAYYGAESLNLEPVDEESLKLISELAGFFDKKPGWILFPTYG